MAQVIADHRGDEEIAVIIALTPVDGDFLSDRGTGFFHQMGMQLAVEGVIGESLINENFGAG